MRSLREPAGPDDVLVPEPTLILARPGEPLRALGFRLPPIPGVPDPDSMAARALHCAIDATSFSQLPREEVEATLTALAESVTRARYHRMRFDSCLAAAKQRRAALGGPVVADWHAVTALISEAMAFLGAIRTGIDIVVYLAARRAGKSEASADGWDANEAINPQTKPGEMPPTRYDIPELLAIRRRRPWFEELNRYRNVFYHRGFRGNRYGFYGKADTAPEAQDPDHNAALLPDLASLRARQRPHRWTYAEGRRLDDLVESVDAGFDGFLAELVCDIWQQPFPPPGSVPRDEQPTCLLHLPRVAFLQHPGHNVLPVFLTKPAARAFNKFGINRDNLELRAVRPTRIGTEPRLFLLPIALNTPCVIEVYHLEDGLLKLLSAVPCPPGEKTDLLPGVARLYMDNASALYLWQPKALS